MVAREGVVGREVGLAAKDGLHKRRGLTSSRSRPASWASTSSLHWAWASGFLLGIGLHDLAALGVVVLVVEPLLPVRLLVVGLGRLEVEVWHAVHVAVVRDGHGGHLEVDGSLHHVRDACCPVEHRVARVDCAGVRRPWGETPPSDVCQMRIARTPDTMGRARAIPAHPHALFDWRQGASAAPLRARLALRSVSPTRDPFVRVRNRRAPTSTC